MYLRIIIFLFLSSRIAFGQSVFSGDISRDEFGQEETSVAISVTDPNRIVIGANDEAANIRSMPIYLSTDGGSSWNTSHMPYPPGQYQACCDPVLASDPKGGFYYAFLIVNQQASLSNILVAHSADGLTWTYGDPVLANKGSSTNQEDKESIAIDLSPSSSTYGRIYVSWQRFDTAYNFALLELAWSDDEGKSWSPAARIQFDSGFFPQVKVDKHGNVFYSYSLYRDDGKFAGQYVLYSTDHGLTFSQHKIAEYLNYPYSKRERLGTLKGSGGIRAFPYITMDYDQQHDLLHVIYGTYKTWKDGKSSALLFYTNTGDGGNSWSSLLPIGYTGDSSSLESDRFMPAIAADEKTGDAHIIYYSSESDSNNIKCEAMRAIIHADGKAEYKNLSDSLFNPLSVTDFYPFPFIGDYTGCAIKNETYAYSWTEDRKGFPDGEIYAYVVSGKSGISERHQVSAKSLAIYSVYPNPIVNKVTLGFAIPTSGIAQVWLVSIGGVRKKLYEGHFAEGTYTKESDLGTIANGEYFVTVETEYGIAQRKIVIVK
jgi:hypothetical protein